MAKFNFMKMMADKKKKKKGAGPSDSASKEMLSKVYSKKK